jgi:hypothetical protein
MNTHEALENLRLRFTSGNSVPVQSARITREEWEAIHPIYLNMTGLLGALPPLDESKYVDMDSII